MVHAADYHGSLHFVHGHAAGDRYRLSGRSDRFHFQSTEEILGAQFINLIYQNRPLNEVAQLTDISRPFLILKPSERIGSY
jgi:hypothetical protein